MMVRVRPTSIPFAVAVGVGLLAVAPAAAGVGAWTPLGPDGGAILALAVDPADEDVVYAGTAGSLFRSEDGGDSWSFASAGLGDSQPGIRTLAVNGNALLAGTTWDGLWRSLDRGRTWRRATAGLPQPVHVEALLVDPRRGDRLWASAWEGFFVSDDGGASWQARGSLPNTRSAWALAIDATTGQLYAHDFSDLFTSTDDGGSWTLLRCLGRRCGSAAVDPRHPGTLFTIAGGILRSRDAGASWQKLRGPKLPGPSPFVLLGFHGDRLFAVMRSYATGILRDRLFWSADQGDHWAAAEQQPADPSIAVIASAGATLYLGSAGSGGAGGVFRSRDGGDRWEPAYAGLTSRWIEVVAADPRRPGVLYAQASDHLFKSEDDGASWRVSLPAVGVQLSGAGNLLVDPAVPHRVWATTPARLWRSDDRGGSWSAVRRFSFDVYALEADPRTAGGLWAGTGAGLFHTPNGRAWRSVRLSPAENVMVFDVAVAAAIPHVVWAAGFVHTNQPRLYRSADGGQTWRRRDDGLPGWGVTSLALDPERPDTLFATAGDGIFRSRDAGTTWQRLPDPAAIGAPPEAVRWEVVAAPTAPLTLYAHVASQTHDGVYRSTDGGDSWRRVGANTGEAGAGGVRTILVDPHDPRRLLIGTARGILTWTEP
jgi:photosystem II stability/assembly factor-like uncharacterized protein